MKLPLLFRSLAVFAASVLITSCGTPSFVEVTRVHQLPARGAGQTFVATAFSRGKTLDVQRYVPELAAALTAYGWRQTDSLKPDYRAGIDYSLDQTLVLVINDRNGRNVMDARCSGIGLKGDEAVPKMIDCIFAEFPGVSGKRTIYRN